MREPVKFDKPPVVEVACGVAFQLPKPLKTAHVGLYWSLVSSEFPRCDDAEPVAHTVELPGESDSTDPSIQFQTVALPPLRRAWLINQEGTHLLQIQEDRFLFNWKRVTGSPAYPSYEQVISDFDVQWNRFRRFLVDQDLGEPTLTQFELSYFNFVEDGFHGLFKDHVRERSDSRFLPDPEACTFKEVYTLPDSAGRLHILAGTARNRATGKKGVRLEITARGMLPDTAHSDYRKWFDTAHEWITHGFADMTDAKFHSIWERTS